MSTIHAELRHGPLTGIRVLELSHWWAAPHAGTVLAHLGADVVHVESVSHVDAMRYMNQSNAGPLAPGIRSWDRSAAYNEVNLGKRGITLDLTTARGLELCKRLVAQSDVVTESFRPSVLSNLGLGYEELRRVKDDIILVSFPALGVSGRWSQYSGYGMSVIQLAGQHAVNGYRDDPRSPGSPNVDAPVGVFGALAILTALAYRERSGEGQWVDMAQTEADGSIFGPFVINASVHPEEERSWHRWGNRHHTFAPQGVYPCRGTDNWVAISIRGDDDWARFGSLPGVGPWARADRFATVQARRAQHDELDGLLAQWTAAADRFELEAELQAAGVPAGAVRRPSEVLGGHHSPFVGQGFIRQVEHAVAGRSRYAVSPLRFEETPGTVLRAAPTLGQHNREVLIGELNLSEEDVQDLERSGVIGNTPAFE